MKTAAVIAVAALALGTMLWAEADAVVAPQPVANRQSPVANRSDAITIPQMMTYQGRLTDASGVPVPNGEYSVAFKLYTQLSGGNPFWSETQRVTTRDGLFSVLLGAVTPIRTGAGGQGLGVRESETGDEGRGTRDEGLGTAYLGMTVAGSEEMAPRLRIAGTGLSGQTDASRVLPGGTDNDDDWVRSSPADSVLYTIRRLGIARGGCSNVLYGNWTCSMTNLGSSCTTGISGAAGQNLGNMAVLGGYGNRTWAPYTSVGGGRNNKAGNDAADTSAIVVGGYGNQANAKFSYIAGGQNNIASGASASIGGGSSNSASGSYTSIGGGSANYAGTSYSTIGGGLFNRVAYAGFATVAGGDSNWADDYASTVGGGRFNVAWMPYSTVAGGDTNRAQNSYSSVGGGSHNLAAGLYSTVGGGYGNRADSAYATVGGGRCDTARATYATVGGGDSNHADSAYATVPGGYVNIASNRCATVGGGWNSTASGLSSVVAGGRWNLASADCATVGGGLINSATGPYSTVAGGYDCDVDALDGFAAGSYSDVPSGHDNSAAFNGQTTTASGQTRVGALSKASGTFTIDHPLDPTGKILNHYFVEGPEMRNIYDGEAVLDASGRAEVKLPDYFDALNRNPRVQLTGVGTREVIYVPADVSGNRFIIGGPAGAKVYWQVTGERKDPSAEITRIIMPVEQPKTGALAGHSLDDDFLRSTKDQLDRMGAGGQFNFRTAEGSQQYQKSKQRIKEHGEGR